MSIQTSYANATASHKDFKIGQVANTLPCKVESGVLGGTSTTSLPFGRACQWTGENAVGVGAARKRIGQIASAVSSGTSININLDPGQVRPAAGSRIYIGNTANVVNVVAANNGYTVATSVSNVAANTEVTLVDGGPTTFAGVALANRVLPADNTPDADNYNYRDHVSVGAEGDFVVEVSEGVIYGEGAGVNISTANDNRDYGKFTANPAGDTVIGIPGAAFVSASQTINGKALAILRLPKQST